MAERICPICKAPALAIDHPSGVYPFCSKRCKLLDLGAWASEKYRVESSESVDLENELADQEKDDA